MDAPAFDLGSRISMASSTMTDAGMARASAHFFGSLAYREAESRAALAGCYRRRRPKIRETIRRMIAIQNRTWATSDAVPATPPKPSTPATMAMTRKIRAQYSILPKFIARSFARSRVGQSRAPVRADRAAEILQPRRDLNCARHRAVPARRDDKAAACERLRGVWHLLQRSCYGCQSCLRAGALRS